MTKTVLTPDLIDQIVEGILVGEHPSRAAARRGASAAQWKSWSELGERLSDAAAASEVQDDLTDHEQLCLALFRRVDHAEAECEGQWIANIRTAASAGRGKDWTAWMTLLERRFPARWGKRPQDAPVEAETMEQVLDRIRRESA